MSMGASGLPWNAQQREWLQALGHDVLVPVGADAAAEPVRNTIPAAEPRGGARPDPAAKPAPGGSPLLRALARAAGRSEHDPEFLGALPDVATLRGNPAARRALWPHLRALRKRARP
jgi:hypothetical protein